jgi:hypothetical protein
MYVRSEDGCLLKLLTDDLEVFAVSVITITLMIETASTSETSVNFTALHGATTAVRNSSL